MKDLRIFLSGISTGIVIILIALSCAGKCPVDYEHKLKIQAEKYEHMLDAQRKEFMVKMVQHGAAVWVARDDGSTTWTEKELPK